MKIVKISSKEVNTKYGNKIKYGLYDGEKWVSAWKAPWCENFKEGDVLDMTKYDLVGRQYQGKTYYDLKPKDAASAANDKIEARLKAIEARIIKLESNKNYQNDDGLPPFDSKESDDLPF